MPYTRLKPQSFIRSKFKPGWLKRRGLTWQCEVSVENADFHLKAMFRQLGFKLVLPVVETWPNYPRMTISKLFVEQEYLIGTPANSEALEMSKFGARQIGDFGVSKLNFRKVLDIRSKFHTVIGFIIYQITFLQSMSSNGYWFPGFYAGRS